MKTNLWFIDTVANMDPEYVDNFNLHLCEVGGSEQKKVQQPQQNLSKDQKACSTAEIGASVNVDAVAGECNPLFTKHCLNCGYYVNHFYAEIEHRTCICNLLGGAVICCTTGYSNLIHAIPMLIMCSGVPSKLAQHYINTHACGQVRCSISA